MMNLPALAQQTVRGIVTDTETSAPVNLAHIINKVTGGLSITGYRGEFELTAAPGDLLAIVKDGYFTRNITIPDSVGLLRISISQKPPPPRDDSEDRKSTRLNSSH